MIAGRYFAVTHTIDRKSFDLGSHLVPIRHMRSLVGLIVLA